MFKAIKDMTFKAIKYRHLPETLETETEVISRCMSRKGQQRLGFSLCLQNHQLFSTVSLTEVL